MRMHATLLRAMRAKLPAQVRSRLSFFTAPFVVSASILAGCSSMSPPDVPLVLTVPADQKLALVLKASGSQVYECQPGKSDPTQFQWALRGPDAALMDANGKQVGKHYAGPTWEYEDGSKVVGAVKASAPSPNADAVAWLLLDAKSTSGPGKFANVKSIQRLQTTGGKPPKEGCTGNLVGDTARTPYTASYYFYVANPS